PAAWSVLSSVEVADDIDRVVDLLRLQMLVARERDDLGRVTVGYRKGAGLVAKMGEPLLLVERDRIVDFDFHPVIDAMLEERVAILGKDDVEVEHHLFAVRTRRNANLR